MAAVRMGCCTQLRYGMTSASNNGKPATPAIVTPCQMGDRPFLVSSDVRC
jgi:hypothetical protein